MAERIPWKPTDKSNITYACWKQEGAQLWLAYGSGHVYRSVGVPQRWYNEMMQAANPARWVATRLTGQMKPKRLVGFQAPKEET